jgi:hypothetical protein
VIFNHSGDITDDILGKRNGFIGFKFITGDATYQLEISCVSNK